MTQGHDDDCGGCATARRFAEAKGRPIPMTLALGHCERCSYSTNSAYVHKVGGKHLCGSCAKMEVDAVMKIAAENAFREASA